MIGQERMRSDLPSYIERNNVLQKHKAATRRAKKNPPHPGSPFCDNLL